MSAVMKVWEAALGILRENRNRPVTKSEITGPLAESIALISSELCYIVKQVVGGLIRDMMVRCTIAA